ncbi:hypothetical protein PCANC_07898 [Puccinia coronata f. sp. avenae]|uniref:Uncharacterized protein n=1 Tax=Puccinia coronata f. sp. avenae TaxID=200324 RepID=A0A2N5UY86_9BASI|nr:hypothetical protein PCANC_07898 [Puccinia coronata f. sp. avenae]
MFSGGTRRAKGGMIYLMGRHPWARTNMAPSTLARPRRCANWQCSLPIQGFHFNLKLGQQLVIRSHSRANLVSNISYLYFTSFRPSAE